MWLGERDPVHVIFHVILNPKSVHDTRRPEWRAPRLKANARVQVSIPGGRVQGEAKAASSSVGICLRPEIETIVCLRATAVEGCARAGQNGSASDEPEQFGPRAMTRNPKHCPWRKSRDVADARCVCCRKPSDKDRGGRSCTLPLVDSPRHSASTPLGTAACADTSAGQGRSSSAPLTPTPSRRNQRVIATLLASAQPRVTSAEGSTCGR